MRLVAIVVMDPPRQIGQPVGREHQMQAAGDPDLLPGLGCLLGTSSAQPYLAEGRDGIAVNGVEDVGDPEELD